MGPQCKGSKDTGHENNGKESQKANVQPEEPCSHGDHQQRGRWLSPPHSVLTTPPGHTGIHSNNSFGLKLPSMYIK